MTLSNFLLNTAVSLLNLATTAPNFDEIHSMIDQASSQEHTNDVLHNPSQECETEDTVTFNCEKETGALPQKEESQTELVPSP